METNKLNIAEILKEKPQGTKLWTPILGAVSLIGVTKNPLGKTVITTASASHVSWCFTEDGKLATSDSGNGERILFPSKDMPDWSKFAWKKDDILENTSDSVLPRYLTFKGYVDDEYTTFEATKGIITSGILTTYSIQDTLSYTKIEDEERVHTVKEKIDKLLREIETANSPDHTLQPFDKVLVRDYKDEVWRPSFYGRKYDNKSFSYVTALGIFKYCIPYNEKTKHLLGTTESYKED